MRYRNVASMPVMKANCETCPFGPNGDRYLRTKIEQRVMWEASQTCHHTGSIEGKPDTHLCRGARDYQIQIFFRMGILEAETDAAWEALAKKGRGE